MKAVSSLAIALAITTPTLAQNQIPAPTLFSIRGGETLPLRLFASITNDCVSSSPDSMALTSWTARRRLR
jgi:hypothetical protein